ncbi:hypothetical protein M758_3G205300 [Ceratodon purpureus]|nr:hypothetical protein M758_3G205300 [Ceratodon purpureus]
MQSHIPSTLRPLTIRIIPRPKLYFRGSRVKSKEYTRAEVVMQEGLDSSSSFAAMSKQGTSFPKLSPWAATCSSNSAASFNDSSLELIHTQRSIIGMPSDTYAKLNKLFNYS